MANQLTIMVGLIGVFAENLVGLGFLQSVSYTSKYKINPNPTKNYLMWEREAQNVIFEPNFSWVELALG